ncbi:Sodium/hydrogen exchanger [Flagelloscypha sp. PMI_526]|nr:Sodium/hydrogen exchanger [Flagelloscypha sp. PMI_526]
MFSLLIKETLYINEAAFGIAIGPYSANIFDPRSWGEEERHISLEVFPTGLFAIGVDLPKSYMAKHAKSLLAMVVPTMAIGWIIVAAVLKALFHNLSVVSCLAIAACLTPTDPVNSAAIVGGKYAVKHVPLNLRRILSAESAANDGLAYPFLTICLFLTVNPSTPNAVAEWFVIGWLYQVIMGTVLGTIIGIIFSKLLKLSNSRGIIDRASYVAQYIALVFLTIGVSSTLGSDDLLAAFACGSAISWDGEFNMQVEGELFSSVIEFVLNCSAFVYIGAWLNFADFSNHTLGIFPWKLIILLVAIIALRRIPAILALYRYIPEISDWKEALFSGHFGPMGVGALFISTLATTKLPTPHDPPQGQAELLSAMMQPIVAFIVLSSIVIRKPLR